MVGRSVETEIPADTIRTSALSNVTRAGGTNVAIFALTSMLLASAVQSPLPKTVHITVTCHYVKQWQCIAVKAGQFRIKIYATESVLLKILQ